MVKSQGIIMLTILMFVLATIFVKGFSGYFNLVTLLRNTATLAILAQGLTFVIILGKMNIAVGSIMSITGIIIGKLMAMGVPTSLTLVLAAGSGAFIGMISGVLIGRFKMDYWIVTFSIMGICSGIALVLSDGGNIPASDQLIMAIGNIQVGDNLLPIIPIIMMLVITLVMHFILRYSKFGSDLLSVGGSEKTSALSGINTTRIIVLAFAISGVLASVSGILVTSKANIASPIAGVGYEFDAIAATVIGGTPFIGGKGTVIGSTFGALLTMMIRNILNLIGMPQPIQYTTIGVIIMIILVLNAISTKYEKERQRG